jgi:hypothetical protein
MHGYELVKGQHPARADRLGDGRALHRSVRVGVALA